MLFESTYNRNFEDLKKVAESKNLKILALFSDLSNSTGKCSKFPAKILAHRSAQPWLKNVETLRMPFEST
jgi:hypothetical protein